MNKPDILSVISKVVNVRKSGKYYWGKCPFHADNNPSLKIDIERQSFKCFGCGESGDVIAFTMKYEGISFKEALERFNLKSIFKSPRNKKQKLLDAYNKWLRNFYKELADTYWAIKWADNYFRKHPCLMSDEESGGHAGFMADLIEIEYKMDIILFGTEREKLHLFQEEVR